MEVIVLAGGLGTRLRSVVNDVPKCMAPVAGKPFLHYILTWINSYNVQKVILAVGYLREVIEDWVENNKSQFEFDIEFSVEEEPLGTGGGIRLAMEKTKSESAIIVNGDTFFDINLNLFHQQHVASNSLLSVALKPMINFDRYGKVQLVDTTIQSFHEKEFCNEGLINGGIYIINKENSFFQNQPAKFSFETKILNHYSEEGLVKGFVHDCYFIDIGIPEDFEKANTDFKKKNLEMKYSDIDIIGYDTLFIDRDGVINKLRPKDYVKTWDEFEFLPGILDAFKIWSKHFKHIIIVTNQRGVGRGIMTEQALNEIHKKMISEIEKHGGKVDKIYYCTSVSEIHPDRKPNIGMGQKALIDFPDITLAKSMMIGDSESDMLFAKNLRVKGVLYKV